MLNSVPSVYSKVAGNASGGSVVQPTSASAIPEKKDSFKKSNNKTLAVTSIGTASGGIAGMVYAKMTEAARKIPRAILDKYNTDFSTYSNARAKIQDRVYKDEFEPLLKSMVDKLLGNEELPPEELKLAKDLDLDPNMVRFFDGAKKRLNILADELNKHPNDKSAISGYSILSPSSDKFDIASFSDFNKWFGIIEENGTKHQDIQEFLDYTSSEYFKDINFKIKYDKNGVANGIIPSIDFKNSLPEGETLSDTTYTFKELVEKVIAKKEFEHNRIDETTLCSLSQNIGVSKNNNHPSSQSVLLKRFNELCESAIDKAKAVNEELKNGAIKAYKNKQMLKFAGIGALAAGALAACGALIYKKVNEKEQ